MDFHEDSKLEDWEIEENRIRKKISEFENRGFLFLQNWSIGFRVPDRYKLPSGKILDEEELLGFFKKAKPEIGNSEHLEVRDAIYYYELINSELFPDRFGYESFLNKKDEKEARDKYNASIL